MDSDEEQEVSSWRGTSATIILINVFDPSKHGTAEVGHIATCRVIRQYLRLSGSRLVGVCLYGTDNINSSALEMNSVIDVFPLTSPTLEDFKKLQDIKVSTLNQASELKLSDAFWHCSKMFKKCNKQLSSRTIIILSRLDTPPAQTDQKPTLKRVVDLVDSGIDIQYINISETDYEVDSFYKNFLTEANKGKEIVLPEPVWDIQKIEQLMYHQSHRHLAVARLCFEIGNGVNIGVGVYNLVKNSSYQTLKTSNLSRETNDILTNVNKTMKISTSNDAEMDVDEEVHEPRQVPILKSELLHQKEYGGEKIEFTDSEMKCLKNPFGPPMLKLLGFKPAGIMCKEKWYLKAGYFLFPNEDIIEGSTVAFKALHQACTETCTVAICVLCTRVNSKPSFVALSPCANPLGLQADMGFDVVKIPFVEDVRNILIEEDESEEITEAHKTVMRDILNNIIFDYKTDIFKNPKLQSQYRAVEAIAFEEDDIEPFIDTTKPSSSRFEHLTDDLFNELFGPLGAVALKRPKASSDTNLSNKRAKGNDVNQDLLHSRLQNKTITEYTVPQLKDILKHKKVAEALTGLKKDQLVELVYKYYV